MSSVKFLILTMAGVLICSMLSQAQSSAGISLLNMKDGQMVRTILCDTTGVKEGTAGTGMTWNISTTQRDTVRDSARVLLPAATTFSDSFSNASFALSSMLGGKKNFSFFRVTSDSLFMLGNIDSLGLVKFSKPGIIAVKNLKMGDTLRDTFKFSRTTMVDGFPNTVKTTTVEMIINDGFGTLILPWKTFNNALRFTTIMREIDSALVAGVPAKVLQTDTKTISWIDTTSSTTDFSIQYVTVASPYITFSTKEVTLHELATAPVHTLKQSGTAALAGATTIRRSGHTISIRTSSFTGNASFALYDMSGKLISKVPVTVSNTHNAKINNISVPNGIYLYSLTSENGNSGVIKTNGKVIFK